MTLGGFLNYFKSATEVCALRELQTLQTLNLVLFKCAFLLMLPTIFIDSSSLFDAVKML